jgi:hypothetical protein
MRKILLGTTAVASAVLGAAVMAPEAAAQEAPTVRIGGSVQAYYGYIQQTGQISEPGTSSVPQGVTGGTAGLPGLTSTTIPGATSPTGTINTVPTSATSGGNQARLSKTDIVTIPQFSVIVTGKLANGLTYGANIDLTFNNQEGRVVAQNNNGVSRTAPAIDEAWISIAHPRFGQFRIGDEDGVMGGLMNSGWITAFGTGGVFGVWENFSTRQGGPRTQTAPGGLGDNSKLVYMTPQFFGFDFGGSFAPNFGSGGQHGCISDTATTWCDRAYAYTGATNAAIPVRGGELASRRNEYQLAARWRGNLAGVGLSATVGYIGGTSASDITTSGTQVQTLNGLSVWQAGAQASFMGFTAGVAYFWGNTNFFWGDTIKGARNGEQLTAGLTYTAGPITIGTNFMSGLFEGGDPSTFNTTTGTVTRNAPPANVNTSTNLASMRRWGLGVGGNYRLAPGLDLIAEYVYHSVREQGRDLDAGRAGIQSRSFANVFLVGSRLAF